VGAIEVSQVRLG